MAQPDVVALLMEQMRMMGELAKAFEAAGKMISKAEKTQIMAIEKRKLEALKRAHLACDPWTVRGVPGTTAPATDMIVFFVLLSVQSQHVSSDGHV